MVLPASSPLKNMARRAESASCSTVQCSAVHAVVAWFFCQAQASERRVPRDRVRDEKGE